MKGEEEGVFRSQTWPYFCQVSLCERVILIFIFKLFPPINSIGLTI